MRGGDPYWDYFPHFLYDLLNTEDKMFMSTMQAWIERENLQMFFDGEIVKDKIIDLPTDCSSAHSISKRRTSLGDLDSI